MLRRLLGSTRSRWPSCARERRARATRSTAIWWSSCRASAAVLRRLNANQLACCVLTAHGTAGACCAVAVLGQSQRFPLGCSVQWRAVGRMIHCAHVSRVTRVHWTTASRAARRRAEGFSSSSKLSLMSVSSECRSDQSTSCNETKKIGARQAVRYTSEHSNSQAAVPFAVPSQSVSGIQ